MLQIVVVWKLQFEKSYLKKKCQLKRIFGYSFPYLKTNFKKMTKENMNK